MSTEPKIASNELEDFTEGGGLYPGGTFKVTEFRYSLGDAFGTKPPDSQIEVRCGGMPTDGSNEGKPLMIQWSVGQAAFFQPDNTGGHLIAVGTHEQQTGSSNWAFVLDKLRKSCGLERGKLSGPSGLRILEGTVLTVARIPQPKRDGLNSDAAEAPQGSGGGGAAGGKRVPTILVPTRAQFPWEGRGATQAQSSAPAQAAAAAASTASANGTATASNGAASLGTALSAALARHNGKLDLAGLGKALLDELVGVDKMARLAIIKESKDVASLELLAMENGWNYDAAAGTISAA